MIIIAYNILLQIKKSNLFLNFEKERNTLNLLKHDSKLNFNFDKFIQTLFFIFTENNTGQQKITFF